MPRFNFFQKSESNSQSTAKSKKLAVITTGRRSRSMSPIVKSRRAILVDEDSRNDETPIREVILENNASKQGSHGMGVDFISSNDQTISTPRKKGHTRPKANRKDTPNLPVKPRRQNNIPPKISENETIVLTQKYDDDKREELFADSDNRSLMHPKKKIISLNPSVRKEIISPSGETVPLNHRKRNISLNPSFRDNNTMQVKESPSKYSPSAAMLEEVEKSSWMKFHQRLEYLKSSEKLRAETVASLQDNHMNIFHVLSWKAPPKLACDFFDLLQPHEYGLLMSVDENGNTPLHLCCGNLLPHQINSSGELACDLSMLRMLLERTPYSLDCQNKEGDTPLHLFLSSPLLAYNSHAELEEDVMDGLVEIIKKIPFDEFYFLRDYSGATPLHTAIANNVCEKAILRLIEANPVACKKEDQQGLTPLHYAAAFMTTTPSIIRKIVQHYKYAICHKTKTGDTPLHVAVRNFREIELTDEKKEMLNILMGEGKLSKSADDLDSEYYPLLITNIERITPMHVCALFNAPVHLITHLLSHPSSCKANLVVNSFGSTPLHIAAAHPHVNEDLLRSLATMNSTTAQDYKHQTPLHVCVQNRHASFMVLKTLIDINPLACNKTDNDEKLPLHLAISSKVSIDVLHALIDAFPIGIEKLTNDGDSVLHLSLKEDASPCVVKFVLDKCPSLIFRPNYNGDLPLHCAITRNHSSDNSFEKIVQMLVELWPQSASFQNHKGDTALHIAARTAKSIETVELLLKDNHGAVLLLNKDGLSPLDVAKGSDAPFEVFDLLQTTASKWKEQALNDGWSGFVDRDEI